MFTSVLETKINWHEKKLGLNAHCFSDQKNNAIFNCCDYVKHAPYCVFETDDDDSWSFSERKKVHES